MAPTWEEILSGPIFVINMDKSPDRLKLTTTRLTEAGFTNIHRFQAVDASKLDMLLTEWVKHGNRDRINYQRDPDFRKYIGKQGCYLSHANIWKHMIDHNIPYAFVVEDDILFHPLWNKLAEKYYLHTPTDWELIYAGCQMSYPSKYYIDRVPVYCTHAMLLTNNGAKKLYEHFVKNPINGIYTIDNMLYDLQKEGKFPLEYYVWNGKLYETDVGNNMVKGWDRRNHGLIFQDDKLGSYIKDHY